MASTLTMRQAMQIVNDESENFINNPNYNFTGQEVALTADQFNDSYVEIPVTPEAIPLGDVAVPGHFICKNLDDTNFFLIGYDDGGFKDLVKVEAGKVCGPFQFSQAAPQWEADTAVINAIFFVVGV